MLILFHTFLSQAEIPGAFFGLFLLLLLAASLIDIKYLYIPDLIPILITLLALLSLYLEKGDFLSHRLAGSLLAASLLGGIRFLTKGGIGGGDVKLMAACGLYLGMRRALLAIFAAYILAGLWYFIPLMRGRVRRDTPVPMAPFFSAAMILAGLWADKFLSWYIGLL
jgi:leader peptidase (prepilin peptidase)/N-methyltransferase